MSMALAKACSEIFAFGSLYRLRQTKAESCRIPFSLASSAPRAGGLDDVAHPFRQCTRGRAIQHGFGADRDARSERCYVERMRDAAGAVYRLHCLEGYAETAELPQAGSKVFVALLPPRCRAWQDVRRLRRFRNFLVRGNRSEGGRICRARTRQPRQAVYRQNRVLEARLRAVRPNDGLRRRGGSRTRTRQPRGGIACSPSSARNGDRGHDDKRPACTARAPHWNETATPDSTRPASSSTSQFASRTQPSEAGLPTFDGSALPLIS